MDEITEPVAMLGAVAGLIVAIGGLFKVIPPIINSCKGIGCDCDFGNVKCKCCMGSCMPKKDNYKSGEIDEVEP